MNVNNVVITSLPPRKRLYQESAAVLFTNKIKHPTCQNQNLFLSIISAAAAIETAHYQRRAINLIRAYEVFVRRQPLTVVERNYDEAQETTFLSKVLSALSSTKGTIELEHLSDILARGERAQFQITGGKIMRVTNAIDKELIAAVIAKNYSREEAEKTLKLATDLLTKAL